MKTIRINAFNNKLLILIFILSGSNFLLAQPMSGNYTVGGNSPDFVTLQDAANSLMANGISGPVIFSIRPGTYSEQGGTAPVFKINQDVTGVSQINSITFKPDETSGGNVNNVILQVNGLTSSWFDRTAILIQESFVTISDLTVQDADTSGAFAYSLIKINGRSSEPLLTNITVNNCRLIGSPVSNETFYTSPTARGTIIGVWIGPLFNIPYANISVIGNYGEKLNQGFFVSGSLVVDNCTVQSNHFTALFHKISSAPANFGSGVRFDDLVSSSSVIIKNNIIDFSGGSGKERSGIELGIWPGNTNTVNAVIDGNNIINRLGNNGGGTFQTNLFTAIWVLAGTQNFNHNILISNNMIAGNRIKRDGGSIGTRAGVNVSCNNAKIYHNSILNPFTIVISGSNEYSRALEVSGENVEVINNLLIDYSKNNSGNGNVIYAILDTVGFVSDYNVFDYYEGQSFAFFGSFTNVFAGLVPFQQTTGRDLNSFHKAIEFEDTLNLHLTNCQMQDPDLLGIFLPEVTIDFDGDSRNTTSPTRGADESVINNFRYWGDTFTADLPGFPFSIAADKFDNIINDNIAVPDYDNKQVLTYHSISNRQFIVSNTLPTPFKPEAVLFHDFDDDGNLDLITGGRDPHGIKVFWGDGIGGFPQSTDVETPASVLNLLKGFNIFGYKPVLVPMGEVFGYLLNHGNRELCFDLQWHGNNIDTLESFMHSFVTGDLDNDDTLEIVGIGHTDGMFGFWNDIRTTVIVPPQACGDFVFERYGFVHFYNFQTGWYSYANSIIKGDFDSDGDLDFVTPGLSQHFIVYIVNEGNFNFSYYHIPVKDFARALAALDYDNDGDLDFVTANYSTRNGITLFLNDGSGNFYPAESCFQDLVEGIPQGIVAKDFDVDGRTDVAVVTSFNKLAVLYNLAGPTSVEDEQNNYMPEEYILEQNFPNPFNPTTTIQFSLPKPGDVTLKIFNLLGEEVKTLADEYREAGKHSVQFNADNLSSGIYFYQIKAGNFVETKKLTLVK
jgi:hypothetical protein